MPSLGSTAARAASAAAAQRLGLAARAGQRPLGGGQAQRPVGDGAGAEARLADDAALDAQRAGDGAHRVVAVARRDLGEARRPSPAPVTGKRTSVTISSGSRQLVRCETKNSSAATRRAPDGRRDLDLAAQRLQHQRQLGRGVGVRDRAAHGAAVARRDVPDVGQRERAAAGRRRSAAGVPLEVALRAQRADAHGAVGDVDHRERRHLAEVDEHGRARRGGS